MSIIDSFKKWCASDTASARCTRTIAQGIIGAIIAYLPDLVSGSTVIPVEYKALVVALAMAILSPIQSGLGDGKADNDE